MNFKKNFKRFFTLSRSAEGFTLVELIVVIAILGILVGVGMPAYGSYVEKAGQSTDDYNLAMISNVFAVACIENGVDPASVAGAELAWSGDKTITGLASRTRTEGADPIVKSFNDNFGSPIELKSYTKADIRFANGVFFGPGGAENVKVQVTLTDKNGNTIGTVEIPASDVMNFEGSTLYQELGAQGLTAKIDFVTGFATDLMGDTTSSLSSYIMSTTQKDALAQKLGYASYAAMTSSDTGVYADMVTAWMGKLATDNPGLDGSEYLAMAEKQIMANFAVVTSAQTAKEMDSDAFLKVLQNSDAKGMIKQGDANAVLTNAALAYAMYSSYAESSYAEGKTVADTSKPDAIMNSLGDEGFQAYLKSDTAKNDLEGYLSALSMASTVVQGSNGTLQDVLTNGYGTDNIHNLIGQVMGSAGTTSPNTQAPDTEE